MPKSNKAKIKASVKRLSSRAASSPTKSPKRYLENLKEAKGEPAHRRTRVKEIDKAAEEMFRRHLPDDPPPSQDPAAIVGRMKSKRDLKPITVKTNCLHCALLSVMADWVEAGYCDTTTALHNMVMAVADVLVVAPAADRDRFVAEVVDQIPQQVAFRTAMDAEGRARMH